MNYISINNLNIQYGQKPVLENFNAHFSEGIHWIQGHNGSGKSSLLKSLCGILPVRAGVVSVCQLDLHQQARKAKQSLCFVPDKPEVYPFMTGRQYLQMIAQIKKTRLEASLTKWLENIGLNPFMDVSFEKMSFGTRRKFTLSACLVAEPKVLLLDEPFNGLDKNTKAHLKAWLLCKRKKQCVLVASHGSEMLEKDYDSITLLSEK